MENRKDLFIINGDVYNRFTYIYIKKGGLASTGDGSSTVIGG